jgi:RNA polymerase sigma-70 factor (ECF subfamily)
MSEGLRDAFLAALASGAEAAAALPAGELEDALLAHLQLARAAWPGIDVAADAFAAHLARHVDDSLTLDGLRALRGADLYLACACAAGDAAALLLFERQYFGEVDIAAARMRAGATVAGEVKQSLRKTLFVADAGRPPAIAEFAGCGDLRGWVRISAVRAMVKLLKRARREVELDDDQLLAVLSPAEDPELRYLRESYRTAFADAFREALAAMPPAERSLIRYQLVDGWSIDQVAELYQIHRSTAARRLAAARAGILERTRAALGAKLRISSEELESVIRLLHSRLDVSIERILA